MCFPNLHELAPPLAGGVRQVTRSVDSGKWGRTVGLRGHGKKEPEHRQGRVLECFHSSDRENEVAEK